MLDWTPEDLSAEDVARLRDIYQPLTESVRALIDATIRTELDAEAVAAAKVEIDAATARLRSKQIDGAFGVRYTAGRDRMARGNPVIGIRNPIAPPLVIERDASGRVFTDFTSERPSKVRPATCMAESPRSYSITSSVRRPVMELTRVSPAPSPCGTCARRASVGCTPRRESTAPKV